MGDQQGTPEGTQPQGNPGTPPEGSGQQGGEGGQQPPTQPAPPPSGEQPSQNGQPSNGEKLLSQEEVNRLMGQVRQKAREAGRLEALRQMQQVQQQYEQDPPQPQGQQPQPPQPQGQAEPPKAEPPRQQQTEQQGSSRKGSDEETPEMKALRELREQQEQERQERQRMQELLEQERNARLLQQQETRFERLAMRHDLTEAQTAKLFNYYLVDKPEDGDAWIQEMRESGLVPKPQAPPEPRPDPDGSPRKVADLERDGVVNVLTLTPEQAREMGKDKILEHYDRMRQRSRLQEGRPKIPRVLRQQRER